MVYYLGYYNNEQIASEKRVAAPPAMNKMGYIISALDQSTDDQIAVISPSETTLTRYTKGSVSKLGEKVSLRSFDSFYSKNKLIRGAGHIVTKMLVARFLMKNIKKDDTLVVYHSLSLMKLVKRVKQKTNCNLIIEVEEIYSDVHENDVMKEKELEYFQVADKFIVITRLLNDVVNPDNKPYIISHGTYKTIQKYADKFDDGRIHVIYAGSFNPVKGGACTAIEAAEFLDDGYVLHILGKGLAADTEIVKSKIEQISAKTSCEISFDGYKTGKEFDSFIQSCHIGLSTQQPDGKYNASSFPSKILMYMSNGLPVVSVRIPAVDSSNVSDYIYYYDEPLPSEIAKAIKSVDITKDFGVRSRLDELNVEFINALRAFGI